MLEKHRLIIAGALILLGSRLATLPRSLWEFDEPLFIQAVWQYEPLHHHPPPPGYPVFIAIAKLFNFFFHDPLTSLVGLSLIGSLVGFIALSRAFQRLSGDELTGVIGAFLFYFSPVMLVHSTLPISDPGALGFLGVTLYAATQLLGYGSRASDDRDAIVHGAVAALTVGFRPQFAIAVLPMLLWVLVTAPRWRHRYLAAATFVVTCAIWFVPLVLAAGGPVRWSQWLSEQASYFATHDAAISRGGKSWIHIAFRFIAHPWGPKWLSFPLLLAAAVGFLNLVRSRSRGFVALATTSVPYLVFALLMMDPADGPRYALPSLPFIAFLAACGMAFLARRVRLAVPALATAFAIGAIAYVSSFVAERARSNSPPVQAAKFAARTIPRNSVVLYELPLWPHAKYLFKNYTTLRIDDGLRTYADRPDVPMFIYADGERGEREGRTFAWLESDAYGKLTRNHYRVVSWIPVPPEDRYRPVRGIHPSERTVIGEEWRWIEDQGEIALPDLGRRRVALKFGLPRHYPFEGNSIEVFVNDQPAGKVELRRESSSETVLDLPPGPAVIRIRAAQSFIPAQLPNSLDRDPRRLSVQLLRVRQLS